MEYQLGFHILATSMTTQQLQRSMFLMEWAVIQNSFNNLKGFK